jgi:hypothetical protein
LVTFLALVALVVFFAVNLGFLSDFALVIKENVKF